MSSTRKILIVDDQESIHEAFRKVLLDRRPSSSDLDSLEELLFDEDVDSDDLEQSFELEFAHQGEQGLEKVKHACSTGTPFGLAFVDMRMPPGWDGVETIERIWEVDPGLQIVVCTAYSDHVWKDVCKKLGKVDQLLLLNKPFASEYVLSLACALTEKRALMEKLKVELVKSHEANKRLEREISCRKEAEQTLLEMATSDTLTGLPNRTLLQRTLRELNSRLLAETNQKAALLFLDIDNFKLVNDSYGHKVGDELLINIAKRMSDHFQASTQKFPGVNVSAYRLGGDEFVILLDGISSLLQSTSFARSVNESLRPPFAIQNRQISISSSIGVTLIDKYVADEDEILRKADTAMYRAKSSGKNRHAVFDDEMHRQVMEQLEMESGLRAALEKHEFRMHYQPIVSLKSQRAVGFEALVRWQKADGQIVSPDRFIPVAEESGLIVPLGLWIAKRACLDFAQWKRSFADTAGCSISINVSKLQLLEPSFADDLVAICAESGLTPNNLNIEITETTVTNTPEKIVSVLLDLRSLGFSIHMDDFGTGHSSLSFLHRFPIDVLKIDRAFVASMVENNENATIIDAIVTLARNLGKEITAEGIETVSQMHMLHDLHCEYGQGYYFAKPTPASEAFAQRGDWSPNKKPALPNAVAFPQVFTPTVGYK